MTFSILATTRAAALVVLLSVLAAPTHAADNRPFKANVDVQEQLGRSTDCLGDQGQPGLQGHFRGTGQATHLGAVLLLSTHCVTPRPDGTIYISRGAMTLQGASGDQVTADYSGFITRSDAGVFTFEGTYFITGGTGRFADAGGMGALLWTVQGEFFTQVHDVTLTADGRISY